jgi:acetate CoA/acetoacetate CoA-transferase beta subunit
VLTALEAQGTLAERILAAGASLGGVLTPSGVGTEVEEGNLANYKVPGRLVPGMGGAMDLTVGAKKVIAATLHFDRGACTLVKRCTLPLTARGEVDF